MLTELQLVDVAAPKLQIIQLLPGKSKDEALARFQLIETFNIVDQWF